MSNEIGEKYGNVDPQDESEHTEALTQPKPDDVEKAFSGNPVATPLDVLWDCATLDQDKWSFESRLQAHNDIKAALSSREVDVDALKLHLHSKLEPTHFQAVIINTAIEEYFKQHHPDTITKKED